MAKILESNIINSALWAAYGDALGFITELADESILKARTGEAYINYMIPWKRKIGGRFGATVDLPAGTYSDDTQLRLATSRTIKSNGHFSIHSFSRLELPVWQNYALGAGRSSKIAANSLSKQSVAWFNNFFDIQDVKYINGGGNGAVMRIQPHIWSVADFNNIDKYLLDVIKNSLTTHGHPRAIAGAVFHAQAIAYIMEHQKFPRVENLREINKSSLEIPRLIKLDPNLSSVWVSQYESLTGTSLTEAYKLVYEEIEEYISLISIWLNSDQKNYVALAKKLDLYNERTRGSGTLTALAASAALFLVNDLSPEKLLIEIVNQLSTDTDSIATMVGAMMGLLIKHAPPSELQDQDYIIKDAKRLYAISKGLCNDEFLYPNAMSWKSSASAVDYISKHNNNLYMYPFGKLTETSQEFRTSNSKQEMYFQWVTSEFGPSFMIKRRSYPNIKEIKDSTLKLEPKYDGELNFKEVTKLSDSEVTLGSISIDQMTSLVIKRNFNDETIGQHIKEIASSELGTNGVIAYCAIVSKAIIARKKSIEN